MQERREGGGRVVQQQQSQSSSEAGTDDASTAQSATLLPVDKRVMLVVSQDRRSRVQYMKAVAHRHREVFSSDRHQ